MKRIFCRVEKCLGCKTCELACAIEHSESKRLVEAMQESVVPTRRIRVELVDDKGALGELQDGVLPAFVNQAVVDLVGNDVKT